MANFNLYEDRANELLSQGARGLQVFHQKDVSTVTGCINRVLLSTLRYVS
jgi:hypothetical protein